MLWRCGRSFWRGGTIFWDFHEDGEAALLDLNPVRAGLAEDPKDYPVVPAARVGRGRVPGWRGSVRGVGGSGLRSSDETLQGCRFYRNSPVVHSFLNS